MKMPSDPPCPPLRKRMRAHQATGLPVQYTLMSDREVHLPAPSFEFLILSLRFQTESQMGATSWGQEQPEVNLPLARHSIDLLVMLQEKTRNNLSLEEQRLLDNTVTELRFRYIAAFEDERKQRAQGDAAPAPQPSASEEAAPTEDGQQGDA